MSKLLGATAWPLLPFGDDRQYAGNCGYWT